MDDVDFIDVNDLVEQVASARADLFHLFPFENQYVERAVNKLTNLLGLLMEGETDEYDTTQG